MLSKWKNEHCYFSANIDKKSNNMLEKSKTCIFSIKYS